MFGLDDKESEHKNAINFLIRWLGYYIHKYKFQNINPWL